MQPDQLTIGFPTYMRRNAIVARLKTLLADPLIAGFKLLVIDNGSTDGTYEAIQAECASPQLTLLRNDTNIGIVRNLTRLVRECQTEYLLMMSDEDALVTGNLAELLAFLDHEKPLFVSSQALMDGKAYRGMESNRPIAPKEFHLSSFYISGLVYHRNATNRFVDKLERMEPVNTAGRLYPLGILAIELMLTGGAWWFAKPLADKREKLPTRISDQGGDSYSALPSRWRQHADYLKYFEERKAEAAEADVAEKLSLMRASQLSSVFDRVYTAIRHECPDSAEALLRGASLRTQGSASGLAELEAKLENFRGMIQRRDDKIAKLEAKLAVKSK